MTKHFNPSVTISGEPLVLRLKTPFRIAHGTSHSRENVLVRIDSGVGEGALPPYYGFDLKEVLAYVHSVAAGNLLGDDPLALERALDHVPPGPPPARAAIDMALHDLWGRQLGQPLYRLFGLSPSSAPPTSLTLSIPETEDALRGAVREAKDWPVLKLKLGAGSPDADEAIVRTVREETDAALCVDANGAWSIEEAAAIIPRLAEYRLAFIEQPIPASGAEAWRELRRRLPNDVPSLIADESVQNGRDIVALAGVADGVNIKLAKAGGLRDARRMIAVARTLDMQVMLGCMIESAVAVTAAGHLAPLVDYADLDGNINVTNDPFQGLSLDRGRILLPGGPGLGITPAR